MSAAGAVTIADWKERESGTLRWFFSASLLSGLALHELMLHHRDGSWWLSFPAKPLLAADGAALRDERGKVRYGTPLEALRQAHPQVFAAERAL
jgi:hypothetical protein